MAPKRLASDADLCPFIEEVRTRLDLHSWFLRDPRQTLENFRVYNGECPVTLGLELSMATFGHWKYSVDRDATILAYARAERGGTDTCSCANCRNFRAARVRVFPAEFLTLLDQLGIDPRKDGEVYHNARLAPGHHDYGGWYHFIGTLEQTGDFSPVDFGGGFTAWMCRASAPRLASLGGISVVQVEFHTEAVPWLLDEPESE